MIEWPAAQSKGEEFYLYLVAECTGKNPKIQVIHNPSSLVNSGELQIQPLSFRLERFEAE